MTESEHEAEFAKWLKRNGYDSERLAPKTVRGFPDRTVWLPNGLTIYVEMKRAGGRLSIHQKRWKKRLEDAGQIYEDCWSADEAINTVKYYLKGGK